MKRKLLGALLSTAMVASLVVGCSGGNDTAPADTPADTEAPADAETPADNEADDASAPAAAGGGKIGISMPTQSLERWNRDGAYLDEQFKAAGFETILTFSDDKTEQQVNDILRDNISRSRFCTEDKSHRPCGLLTRLDLQIFVYDIKRVHLLPLILMHPLTLQVKKWNPDSA